MAEAAASVSKTKKDTVVQTIGVEKATPPHTGQTTRLSDYSPLANDAHERREILRIEAASTFSVAVALQKNGLNEVNITQADLETFQSKFVAVQELQEDGSFTIKYRNK